MNVHAVLLSGPHTTRWRVADIRAYLDRLAPRQPVAAGGGRT